MVIDAQCRDLVGMALNILDENWPTHHAVARMHGSLPMGGVIPMTPIYAFASPASALVFQELGTLQPLRRDIGIAGVLAFEISDMVTPYE
jgi:hypothetical protein